jgi:hypothetical protein
MTLKRIFRYLLVLVFLLVTLVVISFAIVYYKQKEITQWAVEQVNKDFNGYLEVKLSQVSLFHDFPYLDVDLRGISFYESKDKGIKPLYEINHLYLGFRWIDVVRSVFDVRLIDVKGGHVDVVQLANGDINLLQAKKIEPSSGESSSSAIQIHLKKLKIEDFKISFLKVVDSTELRANIRKAIAAIQMDSTQTTFSLQTELRGSLIKNNTATFFHDKNIKIKTKFSFQSPTKTAKFIDTHIQLEQAYFALDGTVQAIDYLDFDLRLQGEKPDFSLFTSFAPPEAADLIAQYKNQGQIYFLGTVQGKLTSTYQPKLNFQFGCKNGLIENIEGKKSIDQLGFVGSFTNGVERNLKTSVFEMRDFSFRPVRGTFRGSFRVQDFTNPQVAVSLISDIDLDFLAGFLGIKNVEALKGQVLLNMNFSELIDFQKPENSFAKLKEGVESELMIKDLGFSLPGKKQKVDRMNLHAFMSAGKFTLDSLTVYSGKSDIKISGSISDLPALFHRLDKNISIRFEAASSKIDFPELFRFDTALAKMIDEEMTDFRIRCALQTSVNNLKQSPLPVGEFFIDDFYAKIKGYPHTLHDIHADVIVTDSSFQLKDLSGAIDQSDFHFNGKLTNYAIWFDSVKQGDTRFDFDLYSEQLKLNNLFTYRGESYLPKDYQSEVIKELRLHGSTDLFFDSQFRSADLIVSKVEGKMRVHPLKIEKLAGRIHYEDDHLTIENLGAKMGTSDFLINLNYYTGKDLKLKKRDNQFFFESDNLDLDQLLNFKKDSVKTAEQHSRAFNIFEIPFTDMRAKATIKKLTHHNIKISNLKSNFRLQANHYMFIDTLAMDLAGGSMAMNGYFNASDPKKIYFKNETKFSNINLDQLLIKFENFGQDVMLNRSLHGSLSGKVSSLFHVHPDLTPILNAGEAHLDVRITNGSLIDFAPLHAMASYFKDKNIRLVRFDTLQNKLDLKNGVLQIPAMTINTSLGFIEMAGSQSLDLKMDYLIRVPWRLVTQVGFQALFGGKKKEEIDPDQVDAIQYRDKDKRVRFLNVRIKGTPDKFDFSLGKK